LELIADYLAILGIDCRLSGIIWHILAISVHLLPFLGEIICLNLICNHVKECATPNARAMRSFFGE
jgi:hypothetical protein